MVSLGESIRIQAKAVLAQLLIERAWERSLESGADEAPWHWADTWPVAKLRFEQSGKAVIVLAGANGGSLPFGPSHIDGTAFPGEAGSSLIAGHRDTHFRLLKDINAGETILVQTRSGAWVSYIVESLDVVDSRQHPVWAVTHTRDELQLITCYPFDALAVGGPLRYIVTASRVTQTNGGNNL